MLTAERWFPVAGLVLGLLASPPGFSQAAESPDPHLASAAQMARGKLLYFQHCVICHQSSGLGSLGVFPPLAQALSGRILELSVKR